MNSKIKECIMILLSSSTDQESQDMLDDNAWSPAVKQCIREEIDRRK